MTRVDDKQTRQGAEAGKPGSSLECDGRAGRVAPGPKAKPRTAPVQSRAERRVPVSSEISSRVPWLGAICKPRPRHIHSILCAVRERDHDRARRVRSEFSSLGFTTTTRLLHNLTTLGTSPRTDPPEKPNVMGLKDLLKRAELPHVNRWIVSLTPDSCLPPPARHTLPCFMR